MCKKGINVFIYYKLKIKHFRWIMKKLCAINAVLILSFFILVLPCPKTVFALDDGQGNLLNNYVIYSTEDEFLFEKQGAKVGDEYIDKDMNCYIIIQIDEGTKTGKAKFVKKYILPKVSKRQDVPASIVQSPRGHIGLYMTHNDESYISGDGTDSVYGAGGIHDIAQSLSLNLNSKRISTTLDTTLHIPHDSNAYTRSQVTAKSLKNKGVDALFDIHRDGTSRSYYIKKVDGKEHCMVRMVVGKANPNYEQNKAFALFLMSVANTYAPWLFVDIYMATGHYNQGLTPYSLLFEMGSHLVEKDLVLQTVPTLSEVISTALYGELQVVPEEEKTAPQEQQAPQEQETLQEQLSPQPATLNAIEQGNSTTQVQTKPEQVQNDVSQETKSVALIVIMGIVVFIVYIARHKIKIQ